MLTPWLRGLFRFSSLFILAVVTVIFQQSNFRIVAAEPGTNTWYEFQVSLVMGKPPTTGQLVLTSIGPEPARGYLTWQYADGTRVLELVTSQVDTNGHTLRFHSHEARSANISESYKSAPYDYVAEFERQRLLLFKGDRTGQSWNRAGGSWSATGRLNPGLKPPPLAWEWVKPNPDSERLLREWSSRYRLGEINVIHEPSENEFIQLSASTDPAVAELAKLAAPIVKQQQYIHKNMDTRDEKMMIGAEVLRSAFATSSFADPTPVERRAENEKTGNTVGAARASARDKRANVLKASFDIIESEKNARTRIWEFARSQAKGDLPAGQVRMQLIFDKMTVPDPCASLSFENPTEKTLHGINIFIALKADAKRVDADLAFEKAHPGGIYTTAEAAEIQKQEIQMRYDTLRAGGSDFVHVSVLPAHGRIIVDVAPMSDAGQYVETLTATLAADEGSTTLAPLTGAMIRTRVHAVEDAFGQHRGQPLSANELPSRRQ